MDDRKPIKRQRVIFALIVLALTCGLAANAYTSVRAAKEHDEFCKKPSDLRRMACINAHTRPADASPLPPEA